jgi:hypothetical protein
MKKNPNVNPQRSYLSGGYGEGLIYLLECNALYKIGFTTDLLHRVSWIRWEIAKLKDSPFGDPASLQVLHTIPTNNMRVAERAIQTKYADKKIYTDRVCEWFALAAADVEWFCGLSSIEVHTFPLKEVWAPGGKRRTLARQGRG